MTTSDLFTALYREIDRANSLASEGFTNPNLLASKILPIKRHLQTAMCAVNELEQRRLGKGETLRPE